MQSARRHWRHVREERAKSSQGVGREGHRYGVRLSDGRGSRQAHAYCESPDFSHDARRSAGLLCRWGSGLSERLRLCAEGLKKCDINNAAIFIAGDSATTMGKVHLTGKDGKVTSVDKTRKFVKNDAGQLRIVVHHSSLEFSGQ